MIKKFCSSATEPGPPLGAQRTLPAVGTSKVTVTSELTTLVVYIEDGIITPSTSNARIFTGIKESDMVHCVDGIVKFLEEMIALIRRVPCEKQ